MNKLFQFYWYNIAKRFTKRKTSKNTAYILDDFADRITSQITTAKFFGGSDLVIFGDSNGEELADYESMKAFPKVSVNIAIGGTRADHWAEFFTKSKEGRQIYREIKGKKIIINVGGNNVLQREMGKLVGSLNTLKRLFPQAYWINIPSVYAELIAGLQGRSTSALVKELREANDLIEQVAEKKLIDIKPFSGNGESTPFFYVLKDAVHYSDLFDKVIRIPLILKVVYG